MQSSPKFAYCSYRNSSYRNSFYRNTFLQDAVFYRNAGVHEKRWPSNEVTLDLSCNCSFKVVELSVTVRVKERVNQLLSVRPYCNSIGLLRGYTVL